MSVLSSIPRPSWIEVDMAALTNNIKEIRRITNPHAQIMAVVKANAYGHGATRIAFTVLDHGADRLGVATLGEGVSLRCAGIMAPILVLGWVAPDQAEIAIRYHIAQTVFTYEAAAAISAKAMERNKKATIHIKVDSGFGRIGFLPNQQAIDDICRILALPGLYVEGLYTHFSSADMPDLNHTREQLDVFCDFVDRLRRRGHNIPMLHAANSAGLVNLPESHFDMVRPGMIMYGHYPTEHVRQDLMHIVPALSLKARVSYVKKVPAGTGISYGHTFVTQRETLVASLPIGYGDGYSRRFSNIGTVLIRGQRVPIIGSICMDQLMLDVTDLGDVAIGEEVVVIGSQGEDRITLEEMAKLDGTINYEVICMLSERLPRL